MAHYVVPIPTPVVASFWVAIVAFIAYRVWRKPRACEEAPAMPIPRFCIRTLMIAVAGVSLNLAFLAWADEQSRRYHCGNPKIEAVELTVVAWIGLVAWLFLRRGGAAR